MDQKVILGDCLHVMRGMEDNSIDFIVTDSPYGVSFMSKGWDKEIPPVEYWKEMLRICKPGSYMACAGLPRMMHRLTSIVEDSGWIIRDMIIHIFGSGFPKSNNFGKKLGEPWNGYGTALKPAWEGWTLAMKPLDGTFAQNAEKWGVGGINIDGCRIPNQGRWPANIIFDEEAAKELDQMTGILKSGAVNSTNDIPIRGVYNHGRYKRNVNEFPSSSGGASRFFYCAKASSSERNRGLNKPSSHPTVKPISLMKYIITLLAPTGNPILLDPFAGSGSTLIAAKELGIEAIGIEKEPEYHEIATQRIKNWPVPTEQYELF